MRFVLSIIALIVLEMSARAMPLAPLSSVPDEINVVEVKMIHPKMTCQDMIRMHQKMMGGKRIGCKELMRMHRKMMGGKA